MSKRQIYQKTVMDFFCNGHMNNELIVMHYLTLQIKPFLIEFSYQCSRNMLMKSVYIHVF